MLLPKGHIFYLQYVQRVDQGQMIDEVYYTLYVSIDYPDLFFAISFFNANIWFMYGYIGEITQAINTLTIAINNFLPKKILRLLNPN
jgi:hypothetical protein